MRRLSTLFVVLGVKSSVCEVATRGIPYSPRGTIQDYTSSPRHLSLAEMQFDFDRRTGRKTNGLYDGTTFVPGVGAQPAERFPFYYPQESPRYGESPPPHKALEDLLPELSSGYMADVRTDPTHAELPEHVRAAKQSIMISQSDSCGEVPRGLVPPPPPSCKANVTLRAYQPPRVHLPGFWWALICLFVFMFAIMGKYGV
ncbi:unnamed protein product [Phytomonas sp. EM1]|nr:unnamed protein product [Phytomonas sp. EM1]|eukprot:CCW63733.1 unnamed protein product [Phytomonas sp. isolate EM1]